MSWMDIAVMALGLVAIILVVVVIHEHTTARELKTEYAEMYVRVCAQSDRLLNLEGEIIRLQGKIKEAHDL